MMDSASEPTFAVRNGNLWPAIPAINGQMTPYCTYHRPIEPPVLTAQVAGQPITASQLPALRALGSIMTRPSTTVAA